MIIVPVHLSSKLKLPILKMNEFSSPSPPTHGMTQEQSWYLGLLVQEKVKTVENGAAVEILQLLLSTVVLKTNSE